MNKVGKYIDNHIGTNFGKYSIIEFVGSSPLSKVYKASHANLKYDVSIKIFDPSLSTNPEFVNSFLIEIKKLARINHPNIVKIYDAGIQNDLIYIITEYISGTSLKGLIEDGLKTGKKISLTKSIKIIKFVGRALSYAHIRNVLHGNVKPSNILMEMTGRVVLADFGIAKMITETKVKHPGIIKQTQNYLAPELIAGGPESNLADIFSLGVIFLEMIIGKFPFSSKKQGNSELSPRTFSLMKNVPMRFKTIIYKAIEKKPTKRYENMAAMVAEIEKLKEAIPEHLAISTSELQESPPSDDPSRMKSSDLRVILHFLRTGQILELPTGSEFSIGRKNENPPVLPDIDLSPFKGYVLGISRMHAKLLVRERDVSIVDLNSTNGTLIFGKKLKPDIPYRLRHGSIISLGELHTQVLIYTERTIQ